MPSLVDVRRFLHCNYNCHDVKRLESFYVDLFGLRVVMRSDSEAVLRCSFSISAMVCNTASVSAGSSASAEMGP